MLRYLTVVDIWHRKPEKDPVPILQHIDTYRAKAQNYMMKWNPPPPLRPPGQSISCTISKALANARAGFL